MLTIFSLTKFIGHVQLFYLTSIYFFFTAEVHHSGQANHTVLDPENCGCNSDGDSYVDVDGDGDVDIGGDGDFNEVPEGEGDDAKD